MPKLFDNGSMFTVRLSEFDVINWAQTWPCFGPRKPIWFQFDKNNGDLVDMKDNTADNDPCGIMALSKDAQAWGLAKLSGKPLTFCADLDLMQH